MFTKLAIALFAASAVIAAPTSSKRDGQFSGKATYYAVGLGACGNTNSDSEMVVALNADQYGSIASGLSSACGKTVTITNTQNGNQATATVVDKCPGCALGSLDMSPTLFGKLSNDNLGQGVFPISWDFSD
ncbi:hypothetical protein L204_100177 [Cryptococcus depauperatus]|nr:hypothetical protein L204_02341 [Cryptococcus depauperatus CBS 7855]